MQELTIKLLIDLCGGRQSVQFCNDVQVGISPGDFIIEADCLRVQI